MWPWCQTRLERFWTFACSPTGQGIIKCSIAYLLGSMATLVPAISRFFGSGQDSKHMVATVTVYFHAARTSNPSAKRHKADDFHYRHNRQHA